MHSYCLNLTININPLNSKFKTILIMLIRNPIYSQEFMWIAIRFSADDAWVFDDESNDDAWVFDDEWDDDAWVFDDEWDDDAWVFDDEWDDDAWVFDAQLEMATPCFLSHLSNDLILLYFVLVLISRRVQTPAIGRGTNYSGL